MDSLPEKKVLPYLLYAYHPMYVSRQTVLMQSFSNSSDLATGLSMQAYS
jgi:hypothetical protein